MVLWLVDLVNKFQEFSFLAINKISVKIHKLN